jgi:hypothetical protein
MRTHLTLSRYITVCFTDSHGVVRAPGEEQRSRRTNDLMTGDLTHTVRWCAHWPLFIHRKRQLGGHSHA